MQLPSWLAVSNFTTSHLVTSTYTPCKSMNGFPRIAAGNQNPICTRQYIALSLCVRSSTVVSNTWTVSVYTLPTIQLRSPLIVSSQIHLPFDLLSLVCV